MREQKITVGDFLTLRERTDKAAEAIGKFFDPRGGMIANTPVTAEDAGVWINVREAREILAVEQAARDYLDCTAEPMYVHTLRGKDCDGGCRLALQNALTVAGETHRTTEGTE